MAKDVPFQWTPDCQVAFDFLRDALCSEPVMAHPDFSLPFILYTDASQVAVGAVLAQRTDSVERVVGFASHSLTAAERKWSTFDRELWAIVWAVRHFRHYLGLQAFTIVTDHRPLLGLRNLSLADDRTGRRSRWVLELDPYDWVIVHKDGSRHANADAMSRRPSSVDEGITTQSPPIQMHVATQTDLCGDPPAVCVVNTSPPGPVEPLAGTQHPLSQSDTTPDQSLLYSLSHDGASIKDMQANDADMSMVMSWVESGQRPPRWRVKKAPQTVRRLWSEFPSLTLIDGLLCRLVDQPGVGRVTQIVLPAALVPELLRHLHGGPLVGHLAFDRVLARARRVSFWPSMHRDIRKWCEECYACQRRKSPVPGYQAPLRSSQVVRPFQRVAADILELPITSKGNRYVLAVEDYYTKYVNLYAVPDQTAMTVASCLFNEYIMEHGVMETLHTDMGRQFESELVRYMCQLLDIKKTRTTPYNPRSDGMVERLNRTVIDQLAKSLLSCGGEWDAFLKQVAFAYNTSVHASTGFTPFFLTHGREARIPAEVFLGSPAVTSWGNATVADFAASLSARLETAFRKATDNATVAQERQRAHYDFNMRHHPYEVGDLVWLHDPTESRLKLAPHWKGPYRVQGRLDIAGEVGVTYELTSPLEGHTPLVRAHYNRLRPYTLPWPTSSGDAPLGASPPALSADDAGSTCFSPWDQGEDLMLGQPPADDRPSTPVAADRTTSRVGRVIQLPRRLRDFIVD